MVTQQPLRRFAAQDVPRIATIHDVMSALADFDRAFGRHVAVFRGQPALHWDLTPSVFRADHRAREHSYIQEFMHAAPVRSKECPPPHDKAAWLPLMQHFGLPTRLLDVTRSILVAAFFAADSPDQPASDQPSPDGQIWALDALHINQRTTGEPALLSLRMLADAPPRSGEFHLLNDAFSQRKRSREPLYAVVAASELDLRLYAQQGLFLIQNVPISIDQQPGAEQFVRRYRVAAEAKRELLDQLDSLGINESRMFPDLEHLASHIRTSNRTGRGP